MPTSLPVDMTVERNQQEAANTRSPLGRLWLWLQKRESSFHLSYILLLVFVVQEAFELRWTFLMEMQKSELFKNYTGLALVIYIIHQWRLSLLRTQGRMHDARSHYPRHKQAGVWATPVFYFHSVQLGYGYLCLLSLVYLGNVGLGVFNPETVRIRKKWFYHTWLVAHISFASFLVMLISYHIFIAFSYK
jgi:methionine sulfoxide reductase heme-binding subunit